MLVKLLHLSFLFLIILDPLGNVPIFVSVLKHLDHKKQMQVIWREMVIALGVMVLFLFFGNAFFQLLHVDEHSLEITGGVILFIIALPMIFSFPQEEETTTRRREPLIVPLAIPAVAGPAILATITLYGSGVGGGRWLVLSAILIAWILTLPILFLAPFLKKKLGENALSAVERFFGYLVILLAVQMVLHGILGAFDFHCPKI